MKAGHEKRSSELGASEIEHASRLLVERSVVSVSQSGGITAPTVHQTINIQPPGSPASPSAQRNAIITRASRHHHARVESIEVGTGPVALFDGGALTMHVVPLSTMLEGEAA